MVQFARLERDVAPQQAASTLIAIRATDDPQIIGRIADGLAQRSIIPLLLLAKQDGGRILVEVQLAIDDDRVVSLLVERLRAMVSVERAMVIEQ